MIYTLIALPRMEFLLFTVVLRAVENKVDVLALTDHDTISGLAEAKAQADLLGIKFINGVEISTNWENYDLFI